MNLLTHLSTFVLAEAEAGGAAGDGGPMSGLVGMLPLLLMFLVIYFLLIRPAGKQRKQHAALLSELKKDDEVVTAAGFFGRIIAIDEKIVTLEIADKVKIRILRDRIAGRWSDETQAAKK
jgi:preprotein translocase subunit YajC